MIVLSIGNLYPPHYAGGYELMWHAWVEHARAAGHVVRVLASDERTGATGPDDTDVHRELRRYWSSGGSPQLTLRERISLERANAAAVRRHLDELQPDVVAWWGMGGMPLSSIEQVRRAGVPAVAFVMDDWLTYQPPGDAWLRLFATRPRLGRIAERVLRIPTRVDFADAATYVFVSETLRRQGPPLPHTAVEPSGVTDNFVDPRPPRPWSWRLLSVGRIDPRKGVATAIEALVELPEATLTVAGSGPSALLADLAALAERVGVTDRVTFAGAVPRAELPALYEAHDAVVFPVVWEEPWGLVPLEAMALGRPVTASGRGGSSEYLRDGENCLLHVPGDPTSVAATVRRLAGDEALRERLLAGGLRAASHYTESRFNLAATAVVTSAAGGRLRSPEDETSLSAGV
ncbi:MAG TPA: glycosyltransferase [Conexibacter sp.]|nr:glycosyltransferase [Conexibacter sp.]